MASITCNKCGKVWVFEPGLTPPIGWDHHCVLAVPSVTARDMEDDVAVVIRELKGGWGANTYIESRSGTLRGAKLALDPDEYKVFLRWVGQLHTIGAIDGSEDDASE